MGRVVKLFRSRDQIDSDKRRKVLVSLDRAPAGKLNCMSKVKTGDRVKIVDRKVTDEDRKLNRYFDHMANLTGVVQNVYGKDEVAVRVDPSKMSEITNSVHHGAVERMRKNFLETISEEAKKQMSADELNFTANFVLLVREDDLEKE